MAKERNQPIGEVDCPRKGCTLKAKLFRYRTQAKDDTRRRFAGRLFCVCDAGHRCDDDQEYLLTQGKIWSPKEHAPAPESAPARAPVKPAPKPQAKPASKPATQQQPAKPQPQQQVKKWGFW